MHLAQFFIYLFFTFFFMFFGLFNYIPYETKPNNSDSDSANDSQVWKHP